MQCPAYTYRGSLYNLEKENGQVRLLNTDTSKRELFDPDLVDTKISTQKYSKLYAPLQCIHDICSREKG